MLLCAIAKLWHFLVDQLGSRDLQVRYESLTGPTLTDGFLTLLTLDVKSNRPNNPVFVDLDFFGGNPSAIGNENQLSTSSVGKPPANPPANPRC